MAFQALHDFIYRAWWQEERSWIAYFLWPFSLVFVAIVVVRRLFYRCHFFKTYHCPVPVIVVGNITVGGNGKTPLVIYLAELLKKAGYQPAIISRGYGSKKQSAPREVLVSDSSDQAGDEPLLMARRTECPVVICPKRVKAIHYVLAHHPTCNVIISDDGLQHYAMGRDIEIAVMDGLRLLGNQWFLPAGPLREPLSRLKQVDCVVYNGRPSDSMGFGMQLAAGPVTSIKNPKEHADRNVFSPYVVHAVAGIGNPTSFFQTLRALRFRFFEHAFPDHYSFQLSDFEFGENAMIIMTEKDAMRCLAFATERYWFLPVAAVMDKAFDEMILAQLENIGRDTLSHVV